MTTPSEHAATTSPVAATPPRAPGARRRPRLGPAAGYGSAPFVCAALLLAALGLWWWAVHHTDPATMTGFGLIDAFPAAFYLAVACVVAALVVAVVAERLSRTAVFAGFGTLILVIYGTPAVVFAEPQYAWVYKHLGVIRYLAAHGSANRVIDIYQNWPGFFAANAWLARATGMDPGDYAAWAPVFFEVCLLAAVLYALGGIIADPRRRYAAAVLWQLGSWVGQDYLSPQAMGVMLVVVALGVVLRIGVAGGWDRAPLTPLGDLGDRWRSRAGDVIATVVRVPGAEDPDTPTPSDAPAYPRSDRAAGLVLFFVLAVAVITSHQLSPVMLILSLTVMTVVTGWRRLWPVVAAVVAIEAVWLLLAWTTLQKFGLLDIGGPVTPIQAGTGSPLAGVSIVQNDARAIGIAFWVLAAVGVVRMLRRTGRDLARPAAVVALAITPYVIVPVQSYGGEAGLRAYLFSLPWLAVLALEAIWPSGALRQVPADGAADGPGDVPAGRRAALISPDRPWLLAILAPVLAGALIVAYYGQALADWMSTSDVAAAEWVDNNAPAGSVVYSLGPGLPDKSTARYPLLRSGADALTDTEITLKPLLSPSTRVNGARTALNTIPAGNAPYLVHIPAQVDYLVITPSQRNYARLEGLMTPSQIDGLVADLRRSRDFTVVYDHDGSVIFRYIPGT